MMAALGVQLLGRWFGAGEAGLQEFDLAVVVGLVFGDVDPLAVIVHPRLRIQSHEPFIVALF